MTRECGSCVDRVLANESTGRFSNLITPGTGAFLAAPTLFDPVEFGIPPSDAAALPLATRKLIEHAFLALRDAGIDYRGKDVGVYTAGVGHDASVLGEAVSPVVQHDARPLTSSRTHMHYKGHLPVFLPPSPTASRTTLTCMAHLYPSTQPVHPV